MTLGCCSWVTFSCSGMQECFWEGSVLSRELVAVIHSQSLFRMILRSLRKSGGDIHQVGGGHWGQTWIPACSLCPQWTTDQQLIQTIRSVGVYDVVELKFAENRANGQSKG